MEPRDQRGGNSKRRGLAWSFCAQGPMALRHPCRAAFSTAHDGVPAAGHTSANLARSAGDPGLLMQPLSEGSRHAPASTALRALVHVLFSLPCPPTRGPTHRPQDRAGSSVLEMLRLQRARTCRCPQGPGALELRPGQLPCPGPRPPQPRPRPAGPTAPQPHPASRWSHLSVLPEVLLPRPERFLRLRVSECAQGTAHLLLHQRVLIGDGVQQDGGQLCSDKARCACSGGRQPHSGQHPQRELRPRAGGAALTYVPRSPSSPGSLLEHTFCLL